jgi:hypothetical protein
MRRGLLFPFAITGALLTSVVVLMSGPGPQQGPPLQPGPAVCGPAPNQNITFSQDAKKAVLRLTQDGRNSGVGVSATVPISGIPLSFGLSANDSVYSSSYGSLSEQDAKYYLQREITNNVTAIVAECRYGFCQLNSNGGSANPSARALQQVCSAALLGGIPPNWGTQGQLSQIYVDPDVVPVIFDGTLPRAVVVNIINNTAGVMTLNLPSRSPHVEVSSLNSPLVIAARSFAPVTFQVTRPSAADGVVTETLSFHPNDFSVSGDVDFRIVRSAELLLPPPTVECGTVQQNARVTAFSDIMPGGAFPAKTNDDSSGHQISLGASHLPDVYSEYLNNGGGEARLASGTSCSVFGTSNSSANLLVSLKQSLSGRGGHCCGGASPGGEIRTNPEWNGSASLPGINGEHTWKLTVVSDITKHGSHPLCVLKVDGGLPQDLSTQSAQTHAFDLQPGSHIFYASCSVDDSPPELNARIATGADWDRMFAIEDHISLTFSYQRQ